MNTRMNKTYEHSGSSRPSFDLSCANELSVIIYIYIYIYLVI